MMIITSRQSLAYVSGPEVLLREGRERAVSPIWSRSRGYRGPETVENAVPQAWPFVTVTSDEEVTWRTRVAETEHVRGCPSFVVEMVPRNVHAMATVPVAGVELV